jgi:hypothetical protein
VATAGDGPWQYRRRLLQRYSQQGQQLVKCRRLLPQRGVAWWQVRVTI